MESPVYEESTFPYEILFRFGDTAPFKGQLVGASRTTITQTTKDGVEVATKVNAPEQLALLEGEDGELLSQVIGEVNAQTVVQNQLIQAALRGEQTHSAELDTQLTAAQVSLSETASKLADAQKEIERLTDALSSQVPEQGKS